MGADADGTYETDIVGAASGQTWFGIYSTGTAANLQGKSGAAANFGGYQDFVLDNLVITRVDEVVQESELTALIAKVKKELTKDLLSAKDYARVQSAIAEAEVALKADGKNQKSINIAYNTLNMLLKELENGSKMDPEDASNDLPLDGMEANAGSIQAGVPGEGMAEYAIDNNTGTIWHTRWAGTSLSNLWLDIKLKEATTVAGVRFLQRTGGGQNGRIIKADIMVLKEGETDYKTVKTSEFAASGWNGVTFTAESKVTNVKIKALNTLGNPADTFAAIAEIRILKEAKEEEIKPDKTELKKLVQLAESLKAKEKNKNAKVLEEKIKAAKAVLDNEAASWYDIALAKTNLAKAVKDFEKQADSPSINPPSVPSGPAGPVGPAEPGKSEDKKIEDKKDEPKKNEEVEVSEDKTAQGKANADKAEKTFKKDKRILKALKEVKTETKVLKELKKSISKQLDIVKQLKNYRKAAKNDKTFLSVKKNVNHVISYLEKNKITNIDSLLKKLAKLNKELKKLQASKKNVKNEAKIKKLQKEISAIKLVISSLESAKKFFEK